MKYFTSLTLFFCCLTGFAQTESPADLAWKDVKTRDEHSAERTSIHLREQGLKFWQNYPNDPRRYEWLLETVRFSPHYFKDLDQATDQNYEGWYKLPVDKSAKEAWAHKYPLLKKEFLSSPNVSREDKGKLLYTELERNIWKTRDESRRGEKIDLNGLENQALDLAATYPELYVVNAVESMFYCSTSFGLNNPKKWASFIHRMEKSPDPKMREYAKGKANVLALRKQPMELQFTSVDGKPIDFKNLRGKVVLVDFWDVYCGGCISLMSREIKPLYEKYHDQGFEVVSVCCSFLNDKKEEPKLKPILDKVGVNWPVYFVKGACGIANGYGPSKELTSHYSIRSFSTLFLLNKQGLLKETDFTDNNLEAAVKQLLEN